MSRAPAALLLLLPFLAPAALVSQDAPAGQADGGDWDVTAARGETRVVDFVTEEGTWMSVDLSPDGRWVAFDLLGHVYRVPVEGGEAESLTQESGVAINYHPRYSPDGSRIAFVSDRRGQSNLWVMDADGGDPRPVFLDPGIRVVEPVWTPDGREIVVRQQARGRPSANGIWAYPVDGGSGRALVGPEQRGAAWPSLSPDGRWLYYQVPTGEPSFLEGAWQIRRMEVATGRVSQVTDGVDQAQYRGSSGGAIAPEVAPDGRRMAFARRVPDGTISYEGHELGPRTALFVRDLESGAERMIMDPIELDMSEGIKTLRVLPGYDWSADGRSIVLSQGGHLRRLDVESGRVATIPIRARVHRTLTEQARGRHPVSDGPLEVRFARWPTASPDGERLVFQAVGRLWVKDLPDGEPRRLTGDDFEPLEYTPAWSPDGRWIAFTSWMDGQGGHLWKIPPDGGTPVRLTAGPGEYVNPSWTADGRSVVVSRGSGATFRGRTWANNPWYELVVFPADGGEALVVARSSVRHDGGAQAGGRRHVVRASIGPGGRVFWPEEAPPDSASRGVALMSARPDGSDRRAHLLLPFADEVVVSPDGRRVAFTAGMNAYAAELPPAGGDPPRLTRRSEGVRALTLEGGINPRWRSADVVEVGGGRRYYRWDLAAGRADTTVLGLSVPRDIPEGTVALTGARILTMDDEGVVESGSVVVRGGRIACVGDCDTSDADRVLDATGTTIIPGIVDPHAHHHREHSGILPRRSFEAAAYLAYGVTTTMDPIGWSPAVFPEAEMVEAGVMVGPRMFTTAENLAPGDGARTNEIATFEDALHEVRRIADWGAVAVKQYGQPLRQQRQWLAQIGREMGLMVTGEGSDLAYNVGTTLDGQTGWEHPLSYAPIYGDAATFFGRAGATYSPTFVVGGASAWNEEFFWQTEDLWRDPKQQRWLPWRHLVPPTRRRTIRPLADYTYPFIAQAVADIIAEGGESAIGSHGQHHGIGSHWEIWMAASAMEPLEALELATLRGARYLGMEDDLGSLAPGKVADLVVLDGNPLADIHDTEKVRWVMKAGTLYEAATLDEIWPDATPYGEAWWVDPDMLRSGDRPVGWWDRPGSGSR